VDALVQLGSAAKKVGPWTVTDKPADFLAPSGNAHDYYHPAPYFWPTADGKVVRKDGERFPVTLLHDPLSHRFDRSRLVSMQLNTTALALSYFFTDDKSYAETAADNIRYWFLDEETRMTPEMSKSYGIIEMKDLYFMLDAVRIIEKGGFLIAREQADLRGWFRQYLEWLETSEQGKEEYTAQNNHGLYYDVQLVAVAAYANDTARMLWYLDRAVSRMTVHVKSDGSMPHELKRPTCEHYQMFNLQGWSTLARMGSVVGREMWKSLPDKKGESGLCRAARYAIPYFRKRDKCKETSEAENFERWWPLIVDANHHCPNLRDQGLILQDWFPSDAALPPSNPHDMPIMYHAHDGVAPFWNLGLPYGEESLIQS
jgi:hypothetical protein